MSGNVLDYIARGVNSNYGESFVNGLKSGQESAALRQKMDEALRVRNALQRAAQLAQNKDYPGTAGALFESGDAPSGVKLLTDSDPTLSSNEERWGMDPQVIQTKDGFRLMTLSSKGNSRFVDIGQGNKIAPQPRAVMTPYGPQFYDKYGPDPAAAPPDANGNPAPDPNRFNYDPAQLKQREKEAELQAEAKTKLPTLERAYKTVDGYMGDLQGKLVELYNHKGLGGNYGKMGYLPNIRGSDASNAWALKEQIEGLMSLDKLQGIRDASPTGGALGNVSNTDIDLLKNSAIRLQSAQSEAAVKQVLKETYQGLARNKAIRKQAYETDLKAAQTQITAPPPDTNMGGGQPQAAPKGPARPQSMQEWQNLPPGTEYILPDGRTGVMK